jgi:hypothetical protein
VHVTRVCKTEFVKHTSVLVRVEQGASRNIQKRCLGVVSTFFYICVYVYALEYALKEYRFSSIDNRCARAPGGIDEVYTHADFTEPGLTAAHRLR